MKFYWNPSMDAARNLAAEELLWQSGEDAFMLWQNGPAVIVGRHQNTLAEVNRSELRARNIPVVRRMTGGGAVYHDGGNINFSLIQSVGRWPRGCAADCLAPMLAALARLGAEDVELSGRNDMVCRGVKISGCARSVLKNRMLFHGTLLYDADLSILASVLTPDPEKIRAKGIASVRARVGNLREMLGPDAPETTVFLKQWRDALAEEWHLPGAVPLPDTLMRRAEDLADTKYRSRAWNWGTVFPCDLCRKKHFAAGWITAEIRLRHDLISAVRLTGDFLAERPVEELEAGLAGTPPEYGVLREKLQALKCESCLPGVSAEELAELLAV